MSDFIKEDFGGVFGGITNEKFDNPFLLPSSDYYPNSLSSAFDFCRFLYFTVPIYRQVAKSTVRYFITNFEFPGKGAQEEKSKFNDYLIYTLRLPSVMADMGDEWGCYGNAFETFYFPFKRVLIDTRGERPKFYSLEMFDDQWDNISFDLSNLMYEVPDPASGFKTKYKFPFQDIYLAEKDNIRIRPIDPRYIKIQYNELSGKSKYILKFNERIKSNITSNKFFAINDTPRAMLEAISKQQDFGFFDNEIFHFRGPIISGLSYQNWGLPEPIANFRQIYQILIYQKLDEAIALDYMLPFRLFSAAPSNSNIDILQNLNMNEWTSEISKIIKARRKDKYAMHAFPFPVNYQEFGASGKTLTPKDLLEFQINNLLDCCGFPVELFKCSLNVNQLPTALRLFQNNFWFIHDNFSSFVKWCANKVKDYLNEPRIDIKLQMPKYADNIELTQLKLQLGAQGEIPRRYYLEQIGVSDPVNAVIERRQEDMEIELATQRKQEEIERKAQATQLLEQQLAGDGENSFAPSINDMEQKAQELAQQWLSIPSTGERTKAMQAVKVQNYELYASAKQVMEDLRSSQLSQMKQQV